ncbi:HNH endonuclease signature motif containing protein [Pseudarthrobacter sp. efr-133-R2A-89]|uniref:HNH endonuclease signature motif containing protein n=1 Tax=Pseudarthrobacter sp. efr-133-R2A-89 TaxID=3040302 RepID=UPI0025538194|nr:HNH endonuclease signature motif containing protein [Pseudarthrobacter sp. efr-133-R2A-89]
MGKAAVVKAFREIRAALAVLLAEVDGCGTEPFSVADPLAGLADGCLDVLAGVREVEAGVAGLKAKAAVGYAESAGAVTGAGVPVVAQEMAVAAEVGCVLALGPRAASSFLGTSYAVVNSLPRTLAALQAGLISWGHAVVMADEAASLDAAGAAALEAHFLDPDAPDPVRGCAVGELPAHRFRANARSWRERHHGESIEKRHAKSVADRRVEYRQDRDGMAWLGAFLPADQAAAGWNRLTAISRGAQGPGETRTLTQLRADTFAGAILGGGSVAADGIAGGAGHAAGHGPGSGPGTRTNDGVRDGAGTGDEADLPRSPIRAQVLVTVPVFSLLGLTDEPAVLDGYGPIPPSMARQLVANGAGSFYRVFVDPRDGAPLEIGRTSYRVGKAMRNWLRMRDGKCPFPGCSNSSLDTEADHILAWADGGTTGISNLGQPCPKHHRLRHTTGWKPTPASKTDPPGWTSPAGRHYHSEHQDWEPTKWPPGFVDHDRTAPELERAEPRPPQRVPFSVADLSRIDYSLAEACLDRILHPPSA